jgi:sulfatase modifying factor 1
MTDALGLVALPGGSITLNDARTGSSWTVALASFEIARVPVTADEFGGDARLPAHGVTWFAAVDWLNARSRADGLVPAYLVDGRRVTWRTEADGYRLPTEAEWEFACRAGTSGPTHGPLEEVAWTVFDDVAGPQPVGTKRPNAYGLHDTIGNVWEWCWDYADPARYGDYRAMRGGGWADPSWSARASVRRGSAPDARIDDVGFRVARGAVTGEDGAQGWSPSADRQRASIRGPIPVGWTPLRELLD